MEIGKKRIKTKYLFILGVILILIGRSLTEDFILYLLLSSGGMFFGMSAKWLISRLSEFKGTFLDSFEEFRKTDNKSDFNLSRD